MYDVMIIIQKWNLQNKETSKNNNGKLIPDSKLNEVANSEADIHWHNPYNFVSSSQNAVNIYLTYKWAKPQQIH